MMARLGSCPFDGDDRAHPHRGGTAHLPSSAARPLRMLLLR